MVTIFDPGQAPTNQVNILDNGGMEIWQRGITFTNPVNLTYLADRWAMASAGTTPTATVTREPNITDTGNYALKWNITSSSGNSQAYIYQLIENYQAYYGKTVTVSMRLNTSNSGMLLGLYDGVTFRSVAIPSNATYQTYSLTMPISTGATQLLILFGNNGGAVSTGTFYMDSCMLVIGTNPATFVPIHPQVDLARCQRYYEIMTGGRNYTGAMLTVIGGNQTYFPETFKVTKRVIPTITFQNLSATLYNAPTQGVAGGTSDTANWSVGAGTLSITAFFSDFTRTPVQTTSNTVALSWDWIASADL
jgi:hypothetical protein